MLIHKPDVDVHLIGVSTLDEVVHVDAWPYCGTSNSAIFGKKSVGGIGNIIEGLKGYDLIIRATSVTGTDSDADFIYEYLKNNTKECIVARWNAPTTKALIVVNNDERTSFVQWGCSLEDFSGYKKTTSTWTHIAYLDLMPWINICDLKTDSNIVSADLCLSQPSDKQVADVVEKAKGLDYLFLSVSEISPYCNHNEVDWKTQVAQVKELTKAKCVVFHSRQATIISDVAGTETVYHNYKTIEKANVLGAGDNYCAGFIAWKIMNYTNRESALNGHNRANEMILRRKNEEI